MSFRCRQDFHPSACAPVIDFEQKELPTGEMVTAGVNLGETEMPQPELFDLKNQLEAGIQLEEVNSKVMQASSVNAAGIVRKYTKKSSTSTEVKNEGE